MYGDRRVMVRLHPRCGALLFGLPCHVRRALRTWHVRDGARCGARGAAHGARLTVSSFRDLIHGGQWTAESGQRRGPPRSARTGVVASNGITISGCLQIYSDLVHPAACSSEE